jgi:hypothetical protein
VKSSAIHIVDNMGISKRVSIRCKTGQKQGKKEKEKKTPIRSLPLYIRDRAKQRLASGFPANDLIRHYQSLQKPKESGALPVSFCIASTEGEHHSGYPTSHPLRYPPRIAFKSI